MDNGTSEYTFVTTFFAPEPDPPPVHTPQVVSSHLFSPTSLSAPLPVDDAVSTPATDVVPETPRPRERTDSVFSNESLLSVSRLSKDDQIALSAIWKQIMDPALEHAKVSFFFSFSCSRGVLLIHAYTCVDICTSRFGSHATCCTSPYDDPTHGGGHGRDTEAWVPTTGNLRFWPPAAYVAALPEGDDRPNRGAQEGRRRRRRRLLPSNHHDERCYHHHCERVTPPRDVQDAESGHIDLQAICGSVSLPRDAD